MKNIKISDHIIGETSPPFIIAEMSGNHNHSLDRALKIVEIAAKSGAHAVKLQTYTADTLTIDFNGKGFTVDDPDSLWAGKSLYDLYKQSYTPWAWHQAIFDHGHKHGVIVFSSPFDETAVDFLEDLNCPAYKIASFEIVDIPLIKKTASTNKPIIISTGMATLDEISEAVQAARDSGAKDIVLLKCTSTYPADPTNTNISTIPDMRNHFNCHVGISDHTMGIGVSIASVALGAVIIEKHFTLSRMDGGVDSEFSIEPDELESLVMESERAFHARGQIHYGPTHNEQKSLVFRRSIYVTADIKAGNEITIQNTRIIRPGYGLEPKHYEEILGKKVNQNIKRGTPLSFEHIEA